MLLIVDIIKNQKTSFEDFARMEGYKNNLKAWIKECRKNHKYPISKIELMELELKNISKLVKEIYSGKRNFTSIQYQSKIN